MHVCSLFMRVCILLCRYVCVGEGCVGGGPRQMSVRRVSPEVKKEVTLIFNQCHIFYFPQRFFCHIFVLFGHIFVTFLSYFCHININSWIKGTLWGTLGFDPRFLKGSVKSFYHAKMLVGAYWSMKKNFWTDISLFVGNLVVKMCLVEAKNEVFRFF